MISKLLKEMESVKLHFAKYLLIQNASGQTDTIHTAATGKTANGISIN